MHVCEIVAIVILNVVFMNEELKFVENRHWGILLICRVQERMQEFWETINE
jgi:hypothetical protein